DEALEVSGVSHFLEHMAFKGNEEFSADDVNRIFDEVGANYNASTSEEVTIYHAAILPEYLDQTMKLLTAMMQPSLREEDFEVEKKVILEEIGMYDDMPSFSVYEQAMLRHFAGHPLGQLVLGTRESIAALTAQQMRDYHAIRYGAANLVLVAAGNFQWDHLVDLSQSHCGNWTRGTPGRNQTEACPVTSRSFLVRDEMHQEHVMQLGRAPAGQSDLRYIAEIVASIVGEDGSGRLYWDLVESGDAESCDLGYNDFDGSGAWMTYLCCQPEQTEANLERMDQILAEFNRTGPTRDEFELAKTKIASRIVLGNERPLGRFSALGGNWLSLHQYRTVEDDLKTLRSLTLNDARTLLDAYPLTLQTTAGLGPCDLSS
ncbi:MAG TPA: pitrilysin family protein, partial [Planctomicrobium sp.]|nr:pitrilysin family protein [Planctomicrobium sp.]